MKAYLLASVFLLPFPAWASSEHDHFNSGIDADRPGAVGVSTNSTASDVDRDTSSDGLTARDREVMASLTNSAWGRLVSYDRENNKAKYQQDGRTYVVDIEPPPAPRPAPKTRPIAIRGTPPTPVPTFDPPPAPPEFPAPQPVAIPPEVAAVTMPDIAPPPPSVAITDAPTPKDGLFSDLEEALNEIKARRVNEPPPGTPLTPGETRMAHALRMMEGGLAGLLVGGWNLTARRALEGAIGLAGLGYAKDLMGEPRYAAAARDILSMNEDEWETVARVARHQNRKNIEFVIAARKEMRRETQRKAERKERQPHK